MNIIAVSMEALPAWFGEMLKASAYGAMLVAAFVVLSPLLRVPARWKFALWLLVLLRFLPMPLPESRWSVLNLFPQANHAADNPTPVRIVSPGNVVVHARPDAAPATPATSVEVHAPAALPSVVAASKGAFDWRLLPEALYLGGAAVVLLRLVLAMAGLRRTIRRSLPAGDPGMLHLLAEARASLGIRRNIPLLLTTDLSSPALVGLVRPKLLLPQSLAATLSPDELRLVFLHECAHMRRRDVAVNYFIALLQVAHWFNPVLWLALPRIRADRELACDELVLLHTRDPQSYGSMLLKLFECTLPGRQLATSAIGIVDQRKPFTRRIQMIAAFRSSPRWLALPALAAAVLITAGTFTTAVSSAADAPKNSTAGPVAKPAPIAVTPDSAAERGVAAKLEEPIGEVAFEKQSLIKAIDALREKSGINIVVNWKALEAAGIDQQSVLTLKLSNVPMRRILTTLLNQVGGGTVHLSYAIEDNIVTISTTEELNTAAHLRTHVYNVRDLLVGNEHADGETSQNLIRMITSTNAPDSWMENGGSVGSITEFKGLLTINTTDDVHRQISDLLASLRSADQQDHGSVKFSAEKSESIFHPEPHQNAPVASPPPATAPAKTGGPAEHGGTH